MKTYLMLAVNTAKSMMLTLLLLAATTTLSPAQDARLDGKALLATRKVATTRAVVRHDWHSKRSAKAIAAPRATRVRLADNGTYICSPAGFGNRASCYRR